MGQVNGRGRFSTLHSSETPRPIFMKLEIYNYFSDTTLHAKLQGPASTWVVWPVWCMKVSVVFFVSSPRPQIAFLDTSQRPIRRYASFPPSKCLLGVRMIKFEIWPPLPPKNVKIETLSWRSMENCSRPNSGTVSRIMFKTDWPPKWHHVTWLQGQGHNVT